MKEILMNILKRSIKYIILIAVFALISIVIALSFKGIISTLARDITIIGVSVVALIVLIFGAIKFAKFRKDEEDDK